MLAMQTSARDGAPKAAVLRDQGSNGDRELAAALHDAGFEVRPTVHTSISFILSLYTACRSGTSQLRI
jgi:hypothetical protein